MSGFRQVRVTSPLDCIQQKSLGKEELLISELKQDTKNANKGTKRGHDAISQSLKTLGAGRSILIDKHGNVIAGNKTAAAVKVKTGEAVVETQT